MSTQRARAPKRPVLRVRNVIDDTVTTTQSDLILHTATDPETLVRMIIKLTMILIDVTQVIREYHIVWQLAPGGNLITNPTTSQVLDADAPMTLLTEEAGGQNTETAVGSNPVEQIIADLKSMRKLKPGDTIVMSHISNVASAFTVKGIITLFFKQ